MRFTPLAKIYYNHIYTKVQHALDDAENVQRILL